MILCFEVFMTTPEKVKFMITLCFFELRELLKNLYFVRVVAEKVQVCFIQHYFVQYNLPGSGFC